MQQLVDSRIHSLESNIVQRVLPEILGEKDIRSLLPILGFQPVDTAIAHHSQPHDQAACYTHDNMVVLPPSTDNPNKSQCGLLGVEVNVAKAASLQAQESVDFLRNKELVIFPVYEEWNSRFQFSPRQNWVLFVYVKSQSRIYLLDYTSSTIAGFYTTNLKHIEKALSNALSTLGYTITHPLEAVYLDRRASNNEKASSFWIAYMLYRLNQGSEVSRLKQDLASVTLGGIKQVLSHIPQTLQEIQDDSERGITPSHSSANIIDVSRKAIPLFEIQNYANPKDQHNGSELPPRIEMVSSLVSSGPSIRREINSDDGATNPPTFWSRFRLDVYSKLILSGMVMSALALLCLAMTPPVLPATISTGILGLGVAMFVGGMLGKFGVFNRRGDTSAPPDNPNILVPSQLSNATA